MTYQGVLTKMKTEYKSPVEYFLVFDSDFIHMNQLLNQSLVIDHLGVQCLSCGKLSGLYRQGFCKKCFFESPRAADWILRPELSTAHLGKEDRDLDFEKEMQLQPHIVYLANSGHVKVGVTRKAQLPTRWIDQGAHEALEILETPNRYLAGIAEVALKADVSDKTNWRNMLKNNIKNEDLLEWRDKLKNIIPNELSDYVLEKTKEVDIEFPVLQYPKKPKSLNFKKTPQYKGVLKGIKGQYLIFEDDTVFNIRSNEGNVIGLTVL